METFEDRFIQGQERWHDFNGYRMRYLYLRAQRPNSRPPVVLIHGFLGYTFSWRFNLQEFARDRDVYAIDLLGIGDSDRPPTGTFSQSFSASSRRVLEWMSAIGLANVDLLGTSHGGAIAMSMAVIDRRERRNAVGRLILVAPANPYSRRGRKRIWFFNKPLGAWLLRTCGGIDRIRDLSLDFMYGDRHKVTPATREGYRRNVDHPQSFQYALDVIKTWHSDMDALHAEMPAIHDIPTLLLWGEKDRTVPTRTAVPLQKHFRNADLIIIPGSGHMPYEEDPELFNEAILTWLDETAAPMAKDKASI